MRSNGWALWVGAIMIIVGAANLLAGGDDALLRAVVVLAIGAGLVGWGYASTRAER